jgi:hypothetical protein
MAQPHVRYCIIRNAIASLANSPLGERTLATFGVPAEIAAILL